MKRIILIQLHLIVLLLAACLISCSNIGGGNNGTDDYQKKAGEAIDQKGKLTPEQKAAVLNEMTTFMQKVDEGCPCVTPDKETDPKYIISANEQTIINQYKTKLDESNDAKELRKASTANLQEKYLIALTENAIPAERYMMKMLVDKEINNQKLSTTALTTIKDLVSVKIYELNAIVNELGPELDFVFLEFTKAELKTFIQLRKSIIDELAKR